MKEEREKERKNVTKLYDCIIYVCSMRNLAVSSHPTTERAPEPRFAL